MPSKSIVANQQEPCPHTSPLSAVCSEQWWLSAGYDPVPSAHAGELGHLDKTARSKDEKSPSNARAKNDDEFGGNFRTIGSMQPDGNFDEDSDKLQGQRSSMLLGSSDIPQPPQLELVGHSIACATTPYPDVYYGGIMAAGGPQPLVHPQFYGMHQPMTPFPLEMTQEPIYVNAKQYHAILRRRQSRAKAELERKLIKERKPYLHESRHQHALRRARGSGGRFAKKGEVESQATTSTEERVKSSGSALSLQSAGSSGSETKAADSTESWNSKSSDEHTNRQWGSVSSVQPRQRALAI